MTQINNSLKFFARGAWALLLGISLIGMTPSSAQAFEMKYLCQVRQRHVDTDFRREVSYYTIKAWVLGIPKNKTIVDGKVRGPSVVWEREYLTDATNNNDAEGYTRVLRQAQQLLDQANQECQAQIRFFSNSNK